MRDLAELGFKSTGIETEESISHLESLLGVPLPSQFRRHLLLHGGGYLDDCIYECQMPTPFGHGNIVQIAGTRDMETTIYSETIPWNLLCIGEGHLGQSTCISIAGLDHGKCYAFDCNMRFYWSERDIKALPHLDPSIIEFFRLRDEDELPERPWGYENCYLATDSFDELLGKLQRLPE
ncbi:SMI1/KNR4 family protein [Blastopirellula sp. JC732]|uniref:SMI1/KNR4 family protein n=1 Tax=Blastopirellula sediminis TaxID=2894196 RepID=A0A9X1MIG9_9BACT|nr:SMI1/KNR4 family protein [Blastopirellula sediminis]MCC9607826.1 SMI1/KNR4 family protein [Blastopirellula sediminis]MCC9627381.1 SMI1/KNR4 family protein [Blastopirellula sediminis]